MPLTLHRLRCGVIYTDEFRDYLVQLHREQTEDHPHRILTLDYLRCASGAARGEAWWQLLWMPIDSAPEHRCYRMGSLMIHIPKAAQHGLKDRCLNYENGRVSVLP